jgi:hypothetical protein
MIAYRYWSKACPLFYVANLKGKVGDWEYSTRRCDAIQLSPYWQRRFREDCNSVGVMAHFIRAD